MVTKWYKISCLKTKCIVLKQNLEKGSVDFFAQYQIKSQKFVFKLKISSKIFTWKNRIRKLHKIKLY